MANPVAISNVLPSSTDTGSGRSSTDTKLEVFADISDDESETTPLTSPGLPAVTEARDLIDMYTSVEMGVVSNMDKRDDHLMTMAEVQRNIARVEKKLAQWRAKEIQVLHQLHCISQEVAEKRLTQADINIERAKYFNRQLSDKPRLVVRPPDILSTLSKPSTSLMEVMRVA